MNITEKKQTKKLVSQLSAVVVYLFLVFMEEE